MNLRTSELGADSSVDQPVKSPALWELLAAFALAVAGYLALYHGHLQPFLLSDAHVYATGLNQWMSGGDPYGAEHFGALRFVYPPIFLFAGAPLARLMPAHWGWPLYLTISFASAFALPIVMARFYFRQGWLNAFFALLIFFAAPQFGGLLALESGNMACLLYLLIFLAGIPGLKRNVWGWFYAAVFFAALIKVNFLLMLALPVFAGYGQWIRSSVCTIATMAVYLTQKILTPGLYAAYQRSLRFVLIDEDGYGYGVFGNMARLDRKWHHTVGTMPYLIGGLFVPLLLVSLIALKRRLRVEYTDGVWLTLIIVAIVLANPRLLHYDACVAMPAIFVLLVNALKARRPVLVFAGLFVISLGVAIFVKSVPIKGGYELVLMLASFAAIYWKLRRDATVSDSQELVAA